MQFGFIIQVIGIIFIEREVRMRIDRTHLDCIQQVLDDATSSNTFAGCSALVFHKGAEVGYYESGMADIARQRKFSRSTICRFYSMTKVITAVAAWQLIERGKLELTENIARYIPSFAHLKVQSGDKIVDCNTPITVQDLLNMTSGYSYGGTQDEAHRAMMNFIVQLGEETAKGNQPTTAECARKIASVPLGFVPSTSFEYGVSADILGAVIEEVSGMTLGEYFKKNIFTPLEMCDTGFFVEEGKRERLAELYGYDQDGNLQLRKEGILGIINYPFSSPAFESGGAGLLGTIDDYMKICRMLNNAGELKGARILYPATVRAIATLSISKELTKVFTKNHPTLSGYTYGNLTRHLIDESSSKTITAHTGEFGWDGWTGTYMAVDPENELSIVFFTQIADNGGYTQTARRVRNVIYSALY